MSARKGFWSYVHDDDQAENGRIRQLAADLQDQYALISGESIEVFVDRSELAWGDNWREKIDDSLNSGLFFIPVITPRFFRSTECRRELQTFVRSAENLGVRELILPLVYVDVQALSEESPIDEAVTLVKTFQWVDWRDLRFEDRASGVYRRGVADLAQRLVDANQRIIAEDLRTSRSGVASPPPIAESDDEEPGTLDLLATAEDAMPRLVITINDIGPVLTQIGALLEAATADIQRGDKQGKGFAARLTVSKKLAQDLSGPADRLLELANSYTASLYDIDRGITRIFQQAPEEIRADPSQKSTWTTFANVIKQLADTTNQSMSLARALATNIEPIESMSRDLRPAARKIRQALTILAEGSDVMNEWKKSAEEI
jgi:TIR domain